MIFNGQNKNSQDIQMTSKTGSGIPELKKLSYKAELRMTTS